MIWTAATIQRFSEEGERYIAKEMKCLIARVALDIVAETPAYSLPSTLLFIRRVTWKGKKLDPLPARDFHDINSITQQSEPLWYVFNQQGRNTIRLHPIPAETISADQSGLFGENIATQCIVEYYSLPTDSLTLPAYIRRRLLKYYVLKSCFAQEGKGQNLKSAARMEKRFQFYLDIFKKTYATHYIAQLNILGNSSKKEILAPPKLSYKFGEEGEF